MSDDDMKIVQTTDAVSEGSSDSESRVYNVHQQLTSHVSNREITPEGYLRATATLTRTGLIEFRRQEFDPGADSSERINVYFPHEYVFHEDTLRSMRGKPLSDGHPPVEVDATNHSRWSIGHLGDTFAEQNGMIVTDVTVTDARAVDVVLKGEREQMSIGYTAPFSDRGGEVGGQFYEMSLAGPMRVNHSALVFQGKAGEDVRILQENPEGTDKTPKEVAMSDNQENTDKEVDVQQVDVQQVDIKQTIADAVSSAMESLSADLVKQQDDQSLESTANDVSVLANSISDAITDKVVARFAQVEAEKEAAVKAREDAEKAEQERIDARVKELAKSMAETMAEERADLIAMAEPMVADGTNFRGKSDKEIVALALGYEGVPDGVSYDYLRGKFDAKVEARSVKQERKEEQSVKMGNFNIEQSPADKVQFSSDPKGVPSFAAIRARMSTISRRAG